MNHSLSLFCFGMQGDDDAPNAAVLCASVNSSDSSQLLHFSDVTEMIEENFHDIQVSVLSVFSLSMPVPLYPTFLSLKGKFCPFSNRRLVV